MKAEEASQAQLLDQLREMKRACDSAIRIVEHKQFIKSNRINSLHKKRHELTSAYRRTLRYLDTEINVTRHSQDYPGSLSRRSSTLSGRDPKVPE